MAGAFSSAFSSAFDVGAAAASVVGTPAVLAAMTLEEFTRRMTRNRKKRRTQVSADD